MEKLRSKALSLGATGFGKSTRTGKKYYVVYDGKTIHFGATGYDDYTTHRDPERRRRYLKRAKAIHNRQGELTYNNKHSANYWGINLLW